MPRRSIPTKSPADNKPDFGKLVPARRVGTKITVSHPSHYHRCFLEKRFQKAGLIGVHFYDFPRFCKQNLIAAVRIVGRLRLENGAASGVQTMRQKQS
jgi:hypothetical protein